MTDNFIAAMFAVSAGLIIAAFATVSLFAGLLAGGVAGLAASIFYVLGADR